MGFIHHDEVPLAVLQLLFVFVVSGENVHGRDAERPVVERLFFFQNTGIQDFEIQGELLLQFILPLLRQSAGANYETAFHIFPDNEFLDQ